VLTINAGNASEENRFLDEQLSKNTTVLEFTISHDDLAKGKWGSARVVGTPNSRFELHPKLTAD
jgi:putative alpha-1,2-mannosidase